VFFAGDSAEAKTRIAAFLESLDMRPLDAGGLEMAYGLESAGLLLVGLARNCAGFNSSLGICILGQASSMARSPLSLAQPQPRRHRFWLLGAARSK
jgi:hypothetical protein